MDKFINSSSSNCLLFHAFSKSISFRRSIDRFFVHSKVGKFKLGIYQTVWIHKERSTLGWRRNQIHVNMSGFDELKRCIDKRKGNQTRSDGWQLIKDIVESKNIASIIVPRFCVCVCVWAEFVDVLEQDNDEFTSPTQNQTMLSDQLWVDNFDVCHISSN